MKTIEMSNYSVGESCYNEIPSVCEKYNVKKVIYGHLHGKESFEMGLKGIRNGIEYILASSDYLDFKLIKVLD